MHFAEQAGERPAGGPSEHQEGRGERRSQEQFGDEEFDPAQGTDEHGPDGAAAEFRCDQSGAEDDDQEEPQHVERDGRRIVHEPVVAEPVAFEGALQHGREHGQHNEHGPGVGHPHAGGLLHFHKIGVYDPAHHRLSTFRKKSWRDLRWGTIPDTMNPELIRNDVR